MYSRWAARLKLRSSATAMNARRCRSSIASGACGKASTFWWPSITPFWRIASRRMMHVGHRRHVQPAFPFAAADRQAGQVTRSKSREAAMTGQPRDRTVVGNISLSLDGRTTGPGGEYDMGWIVPHAITNGARNHLITITTPATTVLLGRKNYEGFGHYWPPVANDETADPRDRAFSKWLNSVEKIVFSSTLKVP